MQTPRQSQRLSQRQQPNPKEERGRCALDRYMQRGHTPRRVTSQHKRYTNREDSHRRPSRVGTHTCRCGRTSLAASATPHCCCCLCSPGCFPHCAPFLLVLIALVLLVVVVLLLHCWERTPTTIDILLYGTQHHDRQEHPEVRRSRPRGA